MKTYRLIKTYPGSPKLGTIVYFETEDYYMTNMENGFKLFPKKIVENYPEFWELVVEKDYEILSLIEGKFIYPCDKYSKDYINQLFNTLGVSIHSVKRNDGEIFTIGDKVFSEYVNYTINKISIVNDKCMVSALYDTNNPNGSRLHYNLNNLKKAKQPLFTTEDGVDIFENNTSIYILDKFTIRHIKHKDFNVISKHVKYFSTKEKAEEYILLNKPCLSVNDIKNTFPRIFDGEKELIKLVKSKIQQSV